MSIPATLSEPISIPTELANPPKVTIPKLSLYGLQVSGKAPKLVTSDNTTLLKCYIEEENNFYKHICNVSNNHPHYHIKRFIPEYRGSMNLSEKPEIEFNSEGKNKDISVWLEHVKIRYEAKNEENKFILMENFMRCYELPNILDIKIGGRQEKPEKVTKSVSMYKLKLNGMLKTNRQNATEFISKYHLNSITEYKELLDNIAYYFSIEGKLQVHLIEGTIQKLKQLVLALHCLNGWRFVSTSLCLIYDPANSEDKSGGKIDVKFIDFGRAHYNEMNEGFDNDTSSGMQMIVKMLQDIIDNGGNYEGIKIEKKSEEIVPLSKVKKFEHKKGSEDEHSHEEHA